MKCVFVIPSLQPGGMERVMSELINYFSARTDLELHLLLYGIKRDVFYPVSDNVIVHKPSFDFNNKFRLWSSIRTMVFLRRRIDEIQPASILSFGELWNNFTLLATLGLNYPIFISDRNQPDKRLSKMHEVLRKWLYPKATGIIAQTEKAKEIYSKLYQHSNIKVIGNPIREIQANQQVKKDNIVLTVGRLIETKHHDQLIKLFVRLNKPNWKLIIVGDDALKQQNRQRLQALINELGATEQVILAGKRSDVDNYYRKSKIFAFTSSSEGFPNVIGEAMAAGLPVVSFDCVAGPSDMITDGENGFLVPLFDYEAFEGRLSSLMEDEELRDTIGKAGRVSIKTFSIDKIGAQFSQLLFP